MQLTLHICLTTWEISKNIKKFEQWVTYLFYTVIQIKSTWITPKKKKKKKVNIK